MDDGRRSSRGETGDPRTARVTLEEFAEEAGLNLSSLAARRSRKEDFPPPVNPGGRPLQFRRIELERWIAANPIRRRPGNAGAVPGSTPSGNRSLERAVELLVVERGAVATQFFLAGLLWLTGHDALEHLLARGSELVQGQSRPSLNRFRRQVRVEGRRALSVPDLKACITLLDGGPSTAGTEPIPADSPAAVRLLLTVLEARASDPAGWAGELERQLLDLSHDSLELSRRTYEGLIALLLALAPPKPGKRFLDPTCGLGSLLIAAHTMEGGAQLVGRDSDQQAWYVTKARLGARAIGHDLGAGPVDSLRDESLRQRRFDSVVAEPGGRLREAMSWLRAAPDLLTDTGTAAIELASETLAAGNRIAWATDRLSAVVITPRAVRRETRDRMAIWVLRHDRQDEVLVIDLSDQDRRSQVTMPIDGDELAALGAIVEAHHRGDDPGRVPGAGRLTAWRVTQDEVARSGVLGAIEGRDPIVGSVYTVDPTVTHGLELARELRDLLDGAGTGTGPLAALVTDEVVRGVRRLVRQLERVVGTPGDSADASRSTGGADLDDA